MREFKNRNYIMEEAITGDYSLVKAWKGDTRGNLVFRGTTQNFNVDAAKAGKITIAEVEQLVQPGELHPGKCFCFLGSLMSLDEIHVPGVYVQRIYEVGSLEYCFIYTH